MENKQKIESQLFQAGAGFGNVVLNFRNRPDDELDFYARSFHRAAQCLAEQNFSRAGYNDLDACPIIFLYRHSLEAYLKNIGQIGSLILNLAECKEQVTQQQFKRHKLSTFLPLLKKIFIHVGLKWDLNIERLSSFDDLSKILEDFDSIDPSSDTFRYPLHTDKTPCVPHHFIFNVPDFCQKMDNLLTFLDGVTMGLREIRHLAIESLDGS